MNSVQVFWAGVVTGVLLMAFVRYLFIRVERQDREERSDWARIPGIVLPDRLDFGFLGRKRKDR